MLAGVALGVVASSRSMAQASLAEVREQASLAVGLRAGGAWRDGEVPVVVHCVMGGSER